MKSPTSLEDLRYPIGQFDHSGPIRDENLATWLSQIAALPQEMRDAVHGLSEAQIDTPYRPGGWTIRQVIHHVPDSHLNAYIRFKWALTEKEPSIKIYNEAAWAGLADYREVPIGLSLDFLTSLHAKLVILLRSLTREQLALSFVHPESGKTELAKNIGIYAWHGRHHVAHITRTVEREGW